MDIAAIIKIRFKSGYGFAGYNNYKKKQLFTGQAGKSTFFLSLLYPVIFSIVIQYLRLGMGQKC